MKKDILDPEEWVWVRRPRDEKHSKGYCMSWFIQRKFIGSSSDAPCKMRVRDNGHIEKDDIVCPGNLIECSEYEAFNYWKPQVNYQIY